MMKNKIGISGGKHGHITIMPLTAAAGKGEDPIPFNLPFFFFSFYIYNNNRPIGTQP